LKTPYEIYEVIEPLGLSSIYFNLLKMLLLDKAEALQEEAAELIGTPQT
jgi:hypothetical protein